MYAGGHKGTHDVVYDYNGSSRVQSLHAYHYVRWDNKRPVFESAVSITLSINDRQNDLHLCFIHNTHNSW